MKTTSTAQKGKWVLAALILTVLGLPAYAAGTLPKGWSAKSPIHIKTGLNPEITGPQGFSPAQIKQAYGIPNTYQGAGQVIAIVDPYDDPNIEADLGVFSAQFGLPACTTANGCFTKIYAGGTQPAGSTSWALEMSLDVEWAHAIAPQAKILLVEGSDDGNGLYEAIQVAIQNKATVISLSWGSSEWSTETGFDYIFQNSPVPIVAASGDAGDGILYPAASPYVLSAGGTTLNVDSNGNYLSETAWSGSGGGISVYEKEPAYQTGFPIPQNGRGRGVPDVAYNADPETGYPIYDSYGYSGWVKVGGTSASAPQWAALIAVANSARASNLTNFNSAIYSAGSSSYATLFHDITSGNNGTCGYYCDAQVGYDYVTGLGSPQAANLLPHFIGNLCVAGNPTLTISPSSQNISPAGSVNFTLSLKNTDSSSCPAASFPLNATIVNAAGAQVGFNNSITPSTPVISPGQSVTSTLWASAPANLPTGTYTVRVSATNAVSQRGAAANATLTNASSGPACVRGIPTLSISPSGQTIAASGSINFTVTLQNTDSASCPASNFPLYVNTISSAGKQVGFVSTLSPSDPLLSPGQSLTSSLEVTAPASLASGVYTAWVSANPASQLNALTSATVIH